MISGMYIALDSGIAANFCSLSTYADIAFLPWEFAVHSYIGDHVKHIDVENKYPNYWAWYQRVVNRESAKKVYAA